MPECAMASLNTTKEALLKSRGDLFNPKSMTSATASCIKLVAWVSSRK